MLFTLFLFVHASKFSNTTIEGVVAPFCKHEQSIDFAARKLTQKLTLKPEMSGGRG